MLGICCSTVRGRLPLAKCGWPKETVTVTTRQSPGPLLRSRTRSRYLSLSSLRYSSSTSTTKHNVSFAADSPDALPKSTVHEIDAPLITNETTATDTIEETMPILPPIVALEALSTTTATTTKPLWQKVWDKYSIGGQQAKIHRAESLFQAARRQSSEARWFGPGRVGREFRPRHAVLTFHVWLLHQRLLADLIEPEVALAVDEELFSILWDDTTCRIRQAGVYELAVNKHLLQVQQYTFQHLTHCDHCYSKPEFRENPIDRLQELRRLVWHHWFQNDPAVVLKNIDDENSTTYDHLDRICWYIDVNYRNIMLDLPDVYYRESRIAWIDLPDFGPFNTIELHDDDILAQPWLRNITTRGVEYYWNPDTGESSYERPKT